jgi:hypothetical protein
VGGVLGTDDRGSPTSVAADGAGNVFVLSHSYARHADAVVVFDMRSYEENVRHRALAVFMSLHRRLGANTFELDDQVWRTIWDAVPRRTEDLSDGAPGRRIM